MVADNETGIFVPERGKQRFVMYYIDLNAITEEHVRGKWEVQNRVVNSNNERHIFSDIKIMELGISHYTSVNGKVRTGRWLVVREEELIYNPQLRFFIDEQEIDKAIITRLRCEEHGNGEMYNLTLYFHTGLELQLHKYIVQHP